MQNMADVALLEEGGGGAGPAGKAGSASRAGGCSRSDGRCRESERRTAWRDLLPGKAGALAIDNTRCTPECIFAEGL